MGIRIVLAGVCGGLVLFAWGAASHMVPILGQVGVKFLPKEEKVSALLKETVSEPAMYIFPGSDETPAMSDEQREAAQQDWAKRSQGSAVGIIAYRPAGGEPMSPGQLLTELAIDIVGCLVAAYIVWLALGSLPGFVARLHVVGLLGLVVGVWSELQYWNWYWFPTAYTNAAVLDSIIGALLAGLPIAAIVRPQAGKGRDTAGK
jgi:hypothetical protein